MGTVHYTTGVDPSPGPEPENVERRFLVLGSGLELLVVLLSVSVLGARLRESERRDSSSEGGRTDESATR